MGIDKYRDQIYAGVLGKIIGVYLGRPVEGWPYDKIRQQFDEIWYYKNHATKAPLIVPDDDISGTFAFFRALRDHGYRRNLSAEEIGNTWLNYIIENQTILWWGGLCRSTEHTAYLRLKEGIPAPRSGSEQLNGKSMAEQIGAQIFIDAWAMACPGKPDLAEKFARQAGSVSHDGIAVDAAVYLAVMEAMAFEEKNIDRLLDQGLAYVHNDQLRSLINDVREHCAVASDWRTVRDWIAQEHGYDRYPGNCPMITNHLSLLMSLIMGGDDFHRACMIACSAGWDTDCNSGNVGALNGIRLGLDGFSKGADLRRAVADRLYVITSDGGSCVSDAVQQTREIYRAACMLAGEKPNIPGERYSFEYPGSAQGFVPWNRDAAGQVLMDLSNSGDDGSGSGLKISWKGLAKGTHASVAVDTFTDLVPKGKEDTSYFEVLGSPALYENQTVTAKMEVPSKDAPDAAFYIEYFDENDSLSVLKCADFRLEKGENIVRFKVPCTKGHPIYRLGICLTSDIRSDDYLILRSLDFGGAPENFSIGRSLEMTPSLTPWTTMTSWQKAFVSSADHWNPDYTATFSISHAEKNGVVTTGTSDWKDYIVSSRITLSMQDAAGLVLRACGHRRYYGAALTKGNAVIYRQEDGNRYILSEEIFDYQIDQTYDFSFAADGRKLTFFIDGNRAAEAMDGTYTSGQAGYVVDRGAIVCDGFTVKAIRDECT